MANNTSPVLELMGSEYWVSNNYAEPWLCRNILLKYVVGLGGRSRPVKKIQLSAYAQSSTTRFKLELKSNMLHVDDETDSNGDFVEVDIYDLFRLFIEEQAKLGRKYFAVWVIL